MQHDFILLDRSGSMSSMWDEALSSINAYVAKLAEDKVDTGVTLATFDDQAGLQFDVIRDRIIPVTWHKVSSAEAQPRGMTPLNDATGKIVNLAKSGNYDKVAIIIMTDGMENASHELTTIQVRQLLDDCRAKNWQVIFLGANFDNAAQAESYGNRAFATANAVKGQMVNSTQSMARARAEYSSTGAAMGFTDEEKQKLANRK